MVDRFDERRSSIRALTWVSLKWMLWAEIIGPVVVAVIAIPMIAVFETHRVSLTLPGFVAGAIIFAGWGVLAFIVRAPAILLSAVILSAAARLKSGIESSVLVSGFLVVLIGCLVAEMGFQFVSGGTSTRGDIPRISWFVWVLSYLLGPRIFVKSLRPGAFEAATTRA